PCGAERVEGASAFQQSRRLALPMVPPTGLLASIITIVRSLQVFAHIAILTKGGPGVSTTVLVYYLYQQAFQFNFFGYGSTLSILLFLIVAVLTFIQWQLRKRIAFYESCAVAQAARRPIRVDVRASDPLRVSALVDDHLVGEADQ